MSLLASTPDLSMFLHATLEQTLQGIVADFTSLFACLASILSLAVFSTYGTLYILVGWGFFLPAVPQMDSPDILGVLSILGVLMAVEASIIYYSGKGVWYYCPKFLISLIPQPTPEPTE